VILPHLQGLDFGGPRRVSVGITSYLAANAIVIPASGWLCRVFGRKAVLPICATLFVVSSFVSGAAPDLTTFIIARIFPGPRRGPIIPPRSDPVGNFPSYRGLAMAVWVSAQLRADPGPTAAAIGRPVVVAADLLHQPPGAASGLPSWPRVPVSIRRDLPRAARIDWTASGCGDRLRLPASRPRSAATRRLVRLVDDRRAWRSSHVVGAPGFPDPRVRASEPIPGPHRVRRPQLRLRRRAEHADRVRTFSGMSACRRLLAEAARLRPWTSGWLLAPAASATSSSLFASGIVEPGRPR